MALPATTRERLRELLKIQKTGQTEVRTDGSSNSVLVSDGVTAIDLEVITIDLLNDFVKPNNKDLSFPDLWVMAVHKADLTLSQVGDKPVETVDSELPATKQEDDKKEESPKDEDATRTGS